MCQLWRTKCCLAANQIGPSSGFGNGASGGGLHVEVSLASDSAAGGSLTLQVCCPEPEDCVISAARNEMALDACYIGTHDSQVPEEATAGSSVQRVATQHDQRKQDDPQRSQQQQCDQLAAMLAAGQMSFGFSTHAAVAGAVSTFAAAGQHVGVRFGPTLAALGNLIFDGGFANSQQV